MRNIFTAPHLCPSAHIQTEMEREIQFTQAGRTNGVWRQRKKRAQIAIQKKDRERLICTEKERESDGERP